ncbi:MAG TPA: Trk system potassium transporter TrkA [Caldithrix abyssi]|uniref:Trk system potassium uptake protein TrkA n=1 Tax=Caldithrix abyssi TaxID=187145 RepID=A0A7V4U2K9_CALAY|nr:Trk system potassium transporter TrkA [Caldithrix abyssi]
MAKSLHIIIIGAGEVGYNLAKMLSYERHDIVLIEENAEKYQRAVDGLDAQVYHGSGTSFRLLEKAGIKKADMLVAVTNRDEVNLIAALMAKQYGVGKTVARVKNREFLMSEAPINPQKTHIDLIIHPESVAAQGTVRLLKQSAATDIIEFARGQIILIGIQLDRNLPILHRPLAELTQEYKDFPFRTIAIQRKDITKIPRGNDVFMPNDRVFVVAPKENIKDVIRITGKENVNIENVMILGGGQIGYLVARELEKQYNVKVIESNIDKSQNLAERLKKSLVIRGDGRDLNLLALEGIIDMDAFISLTGDDETNIISCLMAKHLRVPKIISLINKVDYTPIIPTIGIDAYISKQQLTVNGILKFIRRGAVVSVASIPGISAEAIEMIAQKGSRITKKPLIDLKFPKDAILGAVMRNDKVFIPVGGTQIQAGDKVVLFALPPAISEVEKLFE